MAARLENLTPELSARRYPDVEILITAENVQKYLQSVGYPRSDLGAKLPLSYYTCLREGEFRILRDLDIDLKQVLHITQYFDYHAPPNIGDRIVSKTCIEKVNSRKLGGELVVFLEMNNKFFRSEELVAAGGGSIIVREMR